MVIRTGTARRASRGSWRTVSPVVVVLVAVLFAFGAERRALAGEAEMETLTEPELPHLWEPDQAVAFLLGAPRVSSAGDGWVGARAYPWDGALGAGVTRALFGSYRLVLSSQDLPVCGFSPSCSRFSERVIVNCGLVAGALLSLDRLLRDHPLAAPFYPRVADGHLKDDPDRYCLTAPE
jgi:putative component of membrane protein insertase Oxa1/YidC/SpoIIIJ protein YidD